MYYFLKALHVPLLDRNSHLVVPPVAVADGFPLYDPLFSIAELFSTTTLVYPGSTQSKTV